jgi:hypothetical protein
MGGGLIQLIAIGAQDIYLTGQPQVSYFKSVYRRHTNFATESIQQQVQGNFNFGNTVTLVISRNADLLKNVWIQYNPKQLLGGVSNNVVASNIGHALIEQVDILIGGQLVDRHYGKWLTIWKYLTDNNEVNQGPIDQHAYGPGEQTVAGGGDSPTNVYLPRPTKYNRMSYNHKANIDVIDSTGAPIYAYVPLQFWFCRNPGLAIPLIALQYHEVRINITFGQYNGITDAPTPTGMEFGNFAVYADYVYLDTVERRQFAQNSHEYLIEQLQINSNQTYPMINLNFSHPIKELIWAIPPTPVVGPTYTPGATSPAGSAGIPSSMYQSTAAQPNNYKLIFNGTDRFTERDITYFTRNQVWEAHTGFGSVMSPDSIGVYSFAVKPEEFQPSGTCNFSRLDTAQLSRTNTYPVDPLDVYAVNYNILRIMSGMGGLAYTL